MSVWGSHLNTSPQQENITFCAGRDVRSLPMADEVLLPFDIWTNRAHAIMLHTQNIIPEKVLVNILQGLDELEQLAAENKFLLDPDKEDVHINVESFITEKYGIDTGGRMHIGRSRNDQAACDMRLYLREAGISWFSRLNNLAACLLEQAQKHADSVMPGFTHYQPGMITTWGHWLCSYVQGIIRDLERIVFSLGLINRNPLGSAASFGTSWPINRQQTTELLGFDQIDLNTLDCIVARWENEAQLAQSFAFSMNHLSIISQDLIFLSLPYIGMLSIDDAFVTGSSIMPQKKNPDFAEVIKSKASYVHGALLSLLGIQKGGLSGYNRDTQLTKYLIMDIVRECEQAPTVMQGVFKTLHVHKDVMMERCHKGFMNAVDIADYLARQLKLSFRECYHIMGLAVKYSSPKEQITYEAICQALEETGNKAEINPEHIAQLNTPAFILSQRQHQGSPSPNNLPEQINVLKQNLNRHNKSIENLSQRIDQAYQHCKEFRP